MSGARWTEEEYAIYLARRNHPPVQTSDPKCAGFAKSTKKIQAQEIYQRVRITVRHRSRRLADATGRSHKAAVDGLVRGGILIDDSPKYVDEIREKFETGKDQTIIEIEEI